MDGPPLLSRRPVDSGVAQIRGKERTYANCGIGIDLGKNSCSVVGLDATGKVVIRRRMRRETVDRVCCRSCRPAWLRWRHAAARITWGGRLRRKDTLSRLMSPEYVRPYVKAQKNDDRDAEAIAEAATRPTMRFVALKSEEQLDMQSLHRVRDRLIGERTSLMNQIRELSSRARPCRHRRAARSWRRGSPICSLTTRLGAQPRASAADRRHAGATGARSTSASRAFDEEFA